MEGTFRIWVWRHNADGWELVGSIARADEAFAKAQNWSSTVAAVRVDRCVLFTGSIPTDLPGVGAPDSLGSSAEAR